MISEEEKRHDEAEERREDQQAERSWCASDCSLIETVAWCMAIANARGRFNDVADSPEKEAIIKLEAERDQKKWEAAARMKLNVDGHL